MDAEDLLEVGVEAEPASDRRPSSPSGDFIVHRYHAECRYPTPRGGLLSSGNRPRSCTRWAPSGERRCSGGEESRRTGSTAGLLEREHLWRRALASANRSPLRSVVGEAARALGRRSSPVTLSPPGNRCSWRRSASVDSASAGSELSVRLSVASTSLPPSVAEGGRSGGASARTTSHLDRRPVTILRERSHIAMSDAMRQRRPWSNVGPATPPDGWYPVAVLGAAVRILGTPFSRAFTRLRITQDRPDPEKHLEDVRDVRDGLREPGRLGARRRHALVDAAALRRLRHLA